jgi:hypothetical protein
MAFLMEGAACAVAPGRSIRVSMSAAATRPQRSKFLCVANIP